MQNYKNPKNIALQNALVFESICSNIEMDSLAEIPGTETFPLVYPDEQYKFLHESAVIVYHGIIFCAWYNCSVHELDGVTPIRGCSSADGGKTWSEVETLAEDPTGKLLYCPPVFGICDDTLYMLVNTMVKADHIHSLDLYRYNENTGKFIFLHSSPMPFKLNTNVYRLNNGKLLLPGRIAEMDSFPKTPAVLISDSGKIDAPWRLVYVQKNGDLPAELSLIHPEQSAIIRQNRITLFCRNDSANVPLMYRSADYGETWSAPICHDIPFTNSKIYSGTLADGRHYVIGNIAVGEPEMYAPCTREKLALFITEDDSLKFTKGWLLRDGYDAKSDLHPQWSYPCAFEYDGKLYVIYTMVADKDSNPNKRGAMMSIIDLACLFC